MANDRIVAWLRLRDVGRFVRDAEAAARGIKKMANAAKDGEGPLGALGGALSSLQGVLPQARTETGILGLTLGSLITVVVLGTPIIVGLGGAFVALAGSLGAATLGAGALMVALGGLAFAGLPLVAVLAGMIQGFTKVNTAFAQWNTQVGMYGRNSKQAETALMRLNSVADQFGGSTMIVLVQKWNDFLKTFRDANAPAIQNLIKLFGGFLDLATELMPLISRLSAAFSGSLLVAFDKLGAAMSSGGFETAMDGLAGAFQQLAGPLADTVINLFMGFLTLANRAAPALGWLVSELLAASDAFRTWANAGPIESVIAQFRSWWNLLKAVGGLLVTILSGGATEGKGLVDSLTAIVNKWNEWLKSTEGQNSMVSFFKDAADMTRAFVKILAGIIVFFFKFGRALLPTYTKIFKAISDGVHQFMEALKPMKPFWDNVLGPLLKGIVEGVVGSVVGAFKFLIIVMKILGPVLGWIGNFLKPLKGAFEVIGQIIGFVFGGAILKVLGSLGKLTFLLKPMAAIFRLLELPIRMAGATVEFFAGKLFKLIGFFGNLAYKAFPLFRRAIDAVLDFLLGAGVKFFDAGVWLWKNLRNGISKAIGSGLGFAGDIGKAVYNFVRGLINKGIPNHIGPIDLPNNPIPALAGGGVVSGSGSWITGEAGPEINSLRNGRVTVVPLSPAVRAQGSQSTLAPNEKRVLVTKVYLRNRQIAEAVADEAEDEAARK